MTPQYILRKSLCRRPHCFSAYVPGEGHANRGITRDILELVRSLGFSESTPLEIVADRCEELGNDESAHHLRRVAEMLPEYNRQRVRAATSEIENMEHSLTYCEPGYTNPKNGILFANWNVFSGDVCKILERAGYEIEWSDEWSTCSECGGAVRTSPDNYFWRPHYAEELIEQGELVCLDCHRPEALEQEEDSEQEEPDGPQEDDLTTTDHIRYYQYGKLAFTIERDDRHDEQIREWMREQQHYPSVWFVSDHGNAYLIDVGYPADVEGLSR